MGRRFFRQQQQELTRREAAAHPERWHMAFLERNHPLVHLHEPLDPAGGSLWLRRYPPRLLLWRRFVPSPESSSEGEEAEEAEAPEGAEGAEGAEGVTGPAGEKAEETLSDFETSDEEGEPEPFASETAVEEPFLPSFSLRFSVRSLRGLLQSADWGYGAYVTGDRFQHPLVESPPALLPDPGFLVPRSPESAAHAIVAAENRGLQRLWVTQRAVYQHW